MCGIMGYAGAGNAAAIVYNGLLRLEYRGYDSAGIAVMSDGKIKTAKKRGRVKELSAFCGELAGNVGIGHTRWATHGRPSDKNAHPHSSGKITLVHNGIIENYPKLKEELIASGGKFASETDSEVAAKLVDKNYDGDILEALIKSCKMLEGSYALMVMCEDFDGIAVAKYKSPVIIGLGDGGNFCASDEPALAGLCPGICVLEDGDFALITADEVKIFDSDGKRVERAVLENLAEEKSLDLCGYPHYMLKEINESPAAVRNTASAFSSCGKACEILSGAKRIILTGCGTAYHAALMGKRYIENFSSVHARADFAGELRYASRTAEEGDVLVAVTQSGETADTVEAARLYGSFGAKVLAVTNSPHSAITRIADGVVYADSGAEICVAATKSYSAQLAALYLCACVAAGGDVKAREEELFACSDMLRSFIERTDVRRLAERCSKSSAVYFLGRDLDYCAALEGSLKLKEVSYVFSAGYPAGELKHGTLALVDGKVACVFSITDPALAEKSASAVEQVLSRGGAAAVLTDIDGVKEEFGGRAEIISLPACGKYLAPLFSAAVMQLLAYRTAVILGRDPDKPRNLAKSVTVE